MPEGPEVKVMMNFIATISLGQTLISVQVINEGFKKKTKGLDNLILPKKVIAVESKGKFGYIQLDDQSSIGFTFGMSGSFNVPGSRVDMKHNKVEFRTDHETYPVFYFHCIRNFEWVYYFSSKELKNKLESIGPSILSPDQLDQATLIRIWRRYSSSTICETLMEQKLVSGIGNYIKAEILYRTQTYPLAKVKDLTDEHLWRLYQEAVIVATEAYHDGGASLYTYTDTEGEKTLYKLKLQVYNRSKDPEGRPVERLSTPDKRTTHWVSSVQTVGRPVPVVRPKIKAKLKSQPH